MRLIITAMLSILISISKCYNDGNNEMGFKPVDVINLSIHQYPMEERITYSIDSGSVIVKLSRSRSTVNSILSTVSIPSNEFKKYSRLMRRFKQDKYSNKCIEDGQILTLSFLENDSTIKKVAFSNYYNKELAGIISFLNSKVDSSYKIDYNKKKLLENQQYCK